MIIDTIKIIIVCVNGMTDQDPSHPLEYVKKTKTIRICLACQKEFESRHKFNRICESCKKMGKKIYDKEYDINLTIQHTINSD